MREFWDSIAQAFGYDHWSWGSAADWVGAIGTAGAFLFGFLLLWRDKRRQDRQLADQFATWVDLEGANRSEAVVRAHNGAPTPVPAAWVKETRRSGAPHRFSQVLGQRTTEGFSIASESSTSVVIEGRAPDDLDGLFVVFVDGRGQRWIRSLATGKYVRARKWMGARDRAL